MLSVLFLRVAVSAGIFWPVSITGLGQAPAFVSCVVSQPGIDRPVEWLPHSFKPSATSWTWRTNIPRAAFPEGTTLQVHFIDAEGEAFIVSGVLR